MSTKNCVRVTLRNSGMAFAPRHHLSHPIVVGLHRRNVAARPPSTSKQKRENFEKLIGRPSTVERLESTILMPFSKAYQRRIAQIRRDLAKVKQKGGSPMALIAGWRKAFAPTTVASYTNTLIADLRRQRVSIDPKLLLAQTTVNKEGGPATAQQAPLPDLRRLRLLVQTPSLTVATIVLQACAASRHGDLAKATLSTANVGRLVIVRHNFRCPWKSDRKGVRNFTKFSLLPIFLKNFIWTRHFRLATYAAVAAEMKKIECTVHSNRVWAVTELANAGYSFKNIEDLTGHTPSSDPDLAVRRYCVPSLHQPTSCAQIKMSAELLVLLFPDLKDEVKRFLRTLKH